MDWDDVIGLGVAGNFTGHLEQAGEAADFAGLREQAPGAPRGIFPFYVPRGPDAASSTHFLHCMPISADRIRLAPGSERHQIEPEVALLCDVTYGGDEVRALEPRLAMAHNDCSIRRPGATKISEKKNWGAASKGTAARAIAVDHLGTGGVLDAHRLASFLLRDGTLHEYGVDSPLTGYSYFHERLLDWIVERMNTQRDEGPLEDISRWLRIAGHPARALISIGATRYTPYGESHFLEPGDVSIVALYDPGLHDSASLREHARSGEPPPSAGLSLLRQHVG